MIAEKLAEVRRRIECACARASRPPSAVQLVAVSKLQSSALIREAHSAGQRCFGENYAQELRGKSSELSSLDLEWHAIGPLQTNKAKYIASVASAFHALDRFEIGEALSKRRNKPLDCYVEVNVAGELSKSGVTPENAVDLLSRLRALPNIRVVGLMCMPPLGEAEQARRHFRSLRELAARLSLPGLSMGTTDDFEIAIEEGATVVRVGRSIFGQRPP